MWLIFLSKDRTSVNRLKNMWKERTTAYVIQVDIWPISYTIINSHNSIVQYNYKYTPPRVIVFLSDWFFLNFFHNLFINFFIKNFNIVFKHAKHCQIKAFGNYPNQTECKEVKTISFVLIPGLIKWDRNFNV